MENAAISRIVSRNKRRFLKYNQFRKQLFAELAPKESEAVVYLLPWLLSVNDPRCPGYLDDTTARFRVFGVDNEREIRRREPAFKRLFGVQQSGSLLRLSSPYYLIEGLYTIGSTGTVSQVPGSDCDIWICFDKRAFDPEGWRQLSRKVNLIKDWLDGQYKMPIYFFISDVAAILESRFGSVDQESSGSTQRNVLKEEFYRTFILICGKVPLWWVCQDQEKALDYPTARRWLTQGHNTDYDLIDLGDLNRIERSEYLGAALWQFHKALTHPLKSILKMILLKMLLEAPEKRLLCHRFREAVLGAPPDGLPPDQSLFAMAKALEHIGQSEGDETVAFLKECFHLRCRIDPYNRRQPLKNHLASAFFKEHSLVKAVRNRLRRYDTWEIGAQIDFGNRLFRFLAKIYREMAEAHAGAVSDSDQRDLTILGRKISAGYLARDHKIPVLHKPTASINLSHLTLSLEHNLWHLYPGNNYKQPLASHADVFWLIGFMVFNGLFAEHLVRMRPNASSLTLQEVLNLSRKIREIFGTYDRLDIPYGNYLTPERVSRLLIVVGFERSPWQQRGAADFRVVYQNDWGELFAGHFADQQRFTDFLEGLGRSGPFEKHFYLRRHHTAFEKIIERTKQVMATVLGEPFA